MGIEVKIVNWGFEPNPKGNILWDVKPVDVIWDDVNKKWIIKEDKDDSK